ncbi:MAG: hypothetical protein KAI47_10030, partial [Deltaproteobacteria bacterium]|nr:hypothetical protein [Deltaproteobacteria bacterium]
NPQTTTQLRQPFRGSAPGATRIVASSSAGVSSPATVDSTGRFCIEVELLPDSPNQIILTPLSANGCVGYTTKLSVTHKTTLKVDAGGSSMPQNLSLSAVVTSGSKPKTGAVASVADGDASSWAQFEMWDPEVSENCDDFIWFRFDFGKNYTVSKFKLRWGPLAATDKTYGKCVTFLLSTKPSPVDPDPKAVSDWITVKQIIAGDEKVQEVTISPEAARWGAILLHEDGAKNLLGWETFDIAELEIWGQDPNVIPPPPPDTCE